MSDAYMCALWQGFCGTGFGAGVTIRTEFDFGFDFESLTTSASALGVGRWGLVGFEVWKLWKGE